MKIWNIERTLADIEKQAILEALKHFDYNRTHAAIALGISTRTIRNKLRKYKIPPKSPAIERLCVNKECRMIVLAYTKYCPRCGHGQHPLTARRYL